jgi:hypothetical protein
VDDATHHPRILFWTEEDNWNQHLLQTDKRTIKNNEEDPYFKILNRDYGQQEIDVAHPSACAALLVVAVCRQQVVHTSQKLDGTKIKRSS